MFGFFRKKKKEELHYDPTHIRITDVRKGWFLDYDLKTWEVADEFEYDWGNQNFSYEFMLESQDGERLFLSLDTDDGLTCTLFRKLRFAKLPQADAIADGVHTVGRPPRELTVEGITFYRENQTPGFFRNIDSSEFKEFIVWEYFDDEEKKALNVEQWSDENFEVSIGDIVLEHVFSNITPKA